MQKYGVTYVVTPFSYSIFPVFQQLADFNTKHLGKTIQFNIRNRTLFILYSGNRTAAYIDRHHFQTVAHILLTEFFL